MSGIKIEVDELIEGFKPYVDGYSKLSNEESVEGYINSLYCSVFSTKKTIAILEKCLLVANNGTNTSFKQTLQEQKNILQELEKKLFRDIRNDS